MERNSPVVISRNTLRKGRCACRGISKISFPFKLGANRTNMIRFALTLSTISPIPKSEQNVSVIVCVIVRNIVTECTRNVRPLGLAIAKAIRRALASDAYN